jgi:hypothetical protein
MVTIEKKRLNQPFSDEIFAGLSQDDLAISRSYDVCFFDIINDIAIMHNTIMLDYSGVVLSWHDNGNPECQCNVVNGKIHGQPKHEEQKGSSHLGSTAKFSDSPSLYQGFFRPFAPIFQSKPIERLRYKIPIPKILGNRL